MEVGAETAARMGMPSANGLQGHLEADAAAEQGHQAGEVSFLEERPADDLIHGVVAPHVLGQQKKGAVGSRQGHAMGAAGLLEDGLLLVHPSHEIQERRGGNREGATHRRGSRQISRTASLAHSPQLE